jgi:hypothetical protein
VLRVLPFAVLFAGAAVGPISAQCVPLDRSPRTETFSTVKEIKGQGLAGSELQLDEQRERVLAVLRDYRGSPVPVETKLEGTLEELKTPDAAAATCKVRLSGRDDRGPVRIDGEISPGYFLGTVTRRIGKDTFTYRLSLRRQAPNDNYHVGTLCVPALTIANTIGGYRCGRE